MKYILLIHGNDESWRSFGRETIDEIMRTHASVTEALVASGEFIDSNQLSVSSAQVVRVSGGVPAVTDGPFTEIKEILAGYYLVECASRERAAQIAGQFVEARFAPIEVRQVEAGGPPVSPLA
jgi:hypothetical protein